MRATGCLARSDATEEEVMRLKGIILGLAASLPLGGVAMAEEGRAPAELPPSDYNGQQYVDSKGCLFLRAGDGGQVLWLPRVTRQGQSVCGYPPSGGRVPLGVDPGATAAATPEEAAAPQPAPAATEAGLLVKVGSFAARADARKAEKSVNRLGMPAQIDRVTKDGKTFQVTYAGPFGSADAANAALASIKAAGFADAVVVQPN
jgi:hypothetical protein